MIPESDQTQCADAARVRSIRSLASAEPRLVEVLESNSLAITAAITAACDRGEFRVSFEIDDAGLTKKASAFVEASIQRRLEDDGYVVCGFSAPGRFLDVSWPLESRGETLDP